MFRIAAIRLIHPRGTRPLIKQGLRMVASDATLSSGSGLTKERLGQASPSPKTSVSEKRSKVSERIQQRAQKKAAITLTPTAVEHIRRLMHASDGPKLVRVGVKNKGCAGMSYHLEYVEPGQEGKFDERVKQDDVEVLIDSRALFSIIGSEMDWKEDRMSARFVFNNPNVKDACGCGESFMV